MKHHLQLAFRYLRYLLGAKTKYYIHSTFVYELIEEVLSDERNYYAFLDIEYLRKKLLASGDEITVTDYGAGSKVMKGKQRKIWEIAKYSAIRPSFGRLLFGLATYLKPKQILELGTSLGISTLYLAKAQSKAAVTTLEGCPHLSAYARRNFEILKTPNVEVITGDFKNTLPQYLQRQPILDLVFFDGNHRKEATLDYFNQCLPHIRNTSCFVFDDIHWSTEMEAAWEAIKAHPKVTVTIDVFKVGLVFFHQEQAKEHFELYYFG